MYEYFYPLFALQAFCIYHAYKTRQDQKWYWMIIFFPYIGCLIYLYEAFYSRRTVSTITEGLKQVVNSNYRVEQLESAVKFNNSAQNKLALADAYCAIGRNAEAVSLYTDCLTGHLADDSSLRIRLLRAYYLNDQLEDAVRLGAELAGDKAFRNSEERISLALAYHRLGNNDMATREFEAMDRTFTNFEHRHAYAQYLLVTGRKEEARAKVSELLSEIDMMKDLERRTHREAIGKIRGLSRQLRSA
jgi:hypothetical protein